MDARGVKRSNVVRNARCADHAHRTDEQGPDPARTQLRRRPTTDDDVADGDGDGDGDGGTSKTQPDLYVYPTTKTTTVKTNDWPDPV
ncbi:hypothetical protein Q3G72_028609 [Acer saccharum]|nr:hypothetical protein Q3G72_028609 [Acer saccharum]